jgi:Flp pilus assembly pilin Flp
MKAKISIQKITAPTAGETILSSKKITPAARVEAWVKNLSANFTDNRGATLIEIALYVALVVIVCIGVITALGDKLQGVFDTIVTSL